MAGVRKRDYVPFGENSNSRTRRDCVPLACTTRRRAVYKGFYLVLGTQEPDVWQLADIVRVSPNLGLHGFKL